MLELARNPAKSVEKLDAHARAAPSGGTGPRVQIVEMTLRALSLPASELPPQREPEPAPGQKFSGEALWAAAQCLCAGKSIDPGVATDRQEVGEFVRAFHSKAGVESHPLMSGWRREAIGSDLSSLLAGTARLELSWSDGHLKAHVKSVKE